MSNQKDLEAIWDSEFAFWAGDLNFRIDCKFLILEDFDTVLDKIKKNKLEELRPHC